MCRIIWRLNTQLVTLCAAGLFYMGWMWMSTTAVFVLNPIIAFPLGTILILVPHLSFWD